MISWHKSRFLRRTPASELISDYSSYTKGRFSHRAGTPVLIAARNEAADLPATLISLADSRTEVWPIVIENGSKDSTYKIARIMGATTLRSPEPFKLAALQYGVSMLEDTNRINQPVLFTDADTLVGRTWAATMEDAVYTDDTDTPQVAVGSAVLWDGPSKAVDTLRTSHAAVKDLAHAALDKRPVARGHNMALHLANQAAVDAYRSLDGRLFLAEEVAIMDAIEAIGGRIVRSLGLSAAVLTRGDRVGSIGECSRIRNDPDFSHRRRLYNEYSGIIPYTGQLSEVSDLK